MSPAFQVAALACDKPPLLDRQLGLAAPAEAVPCVASGLLPLMFVPAPASHQGSNRASWEDRAHLNRLLAAMEQRLVEWKGQQQQQQDTILKLGHLLLRFFQFWSGQLSNWALGHNR